MIITCSECQARYNIPDDKIGAGAKKATCSKCGAQISFNPVAAEEKAADISAAQGPLAPPTNAAIQAVDEHYPQYVNLRSQAIVFAEILGPDKKGNFKTKKNLFKLKILQAVSSKLADILGPAEKVYKVGQGFAYYPSEIFFGNGMLTLLYNSYAIICTNERLIFCNINYRKTELSHYFFQMKYDEIKKTSRGLLGNNLYLVRKKGKKRVFQYLQRYIAKDIQEFIGQKITVAPAPGEIMEKLCPACFTALPNGLTACRKCQVAFKKPSQAMLRSLLLPGLGDFFLGHRFLGGAEMLGSLFVWFIIATMLMDGEPGGLYVAAFLLLFYNGSDGLFTWFMGRKGYVLA